MGATTSVSLGYKPPPATTANTWWKPPPDPRMGTAPVPKPASPAPSGASWGAGGSGYNGYGTAVPPQPAAAPIAPPAPQPPAPIDLSGLWNKTAAFAPPPPMPNAAPPPRVPSKTPADTSAATAAEYGRARDTIGLESRAALNALSDEMASRGLSGSSIEGKEVGRVVTGGQRELGDVNRDMAMRELERQSQIEDRDYQGDITQRGQDIGHANAQREAEMSSYNARRALLDRLLQIQLEGGRFY